jgi:hypothetical protein
MEQFDLLRFVTHVITEMGFRYFVTGSTATIFYGEPRFTNDIDIVVDLPETRIVEFCSRFPADEFYVSQTAALAAVRNKTQFNLIHPTSGLKVDLIVPQSSPFNESRFSRARRLQPAEDFSALFASPEDAIIKKMDYYREGGSEKHIRDITGVLKASQTSIDLSYIEQWSSQLGLGDLWATIKKRTDSNS